MSHPSVSPVPTSPDAPPSDAPQSFSIVLLGGGEAGLSILDTLDEAGQADRVLLIEPSSDYYYQPDWLGVGTGELAKEQTRSDMVNRVPAAATWLQESVTAIDAEKRLLTTDQGTLIAYDYLVVALGTTPNWDRVRGLEDHLGTHGICSVYGYGHAEQTWKMIRTFSGGRALFTAPSRPHKGGLAPLTILRRAESVWRDTGVHDQTDLFFVTASSSTLAGDAYSELIERDSHEDNVHVYSGYDLIDIRPERREAVFSVSKGNSQSKDVLPYDLLHVVPPMRPPALLAESDLALQDGPMRGYLPVDPDTLRHPRFDRIFGVGDVLGIEGVKTGERARAQAEKLAQTLLRIGKRADEN